MFDSLVDSMRTHSTEWLEARRDRVVDAQRELRAEELAIVRVLDERGRIDAQVGSHGESPRAVREKVETARALEGLPAVGAAACAGRLSDEQLRSVVKLADEHTDAEWAERAPRMGPEDLARRARTRREPTLEEYRARHRARSFRMWWEEDRGMLQLRGELPDVLGRTFEQTIERITERMKPAKGQPWDPPHHRQADALLELCGAWRSASPTPTMGRPLLQVDVPESGPAEIAGIPLPAAMVEQLRASASVEPVLVDAAGAPVGIGKRGASLSPKVARAVLLRDGHCRCRPGCELRFGLQVHHLRPRSWGGTDEMSNLVAVAPPHHPELIPLGPYALVGNPNQPDGLRRILVSELAPADAAQVGLPARRAGPRSE